MGFEGNVHLVDREKRRRLAKTGQARVRVKYTSTRAKMFLDGKAYTSRAAEHDTDGRLEQQRGHFPPAR